MNLRPSLAFALAGLSLIGVQARADQYVIDPAHTWVTFEVRHFGTSTNRGRFDKKEGTITLDPAAKTGQANITIDMGSIDTGTDKFNNHLKSDTFFNVAKFPTATFVGNKFTFDGDKVKSVSGTLTLLGVSQPVTLTATNYNCYVNPMTQAHVCGGDFETTFARSSFGMTGLIPLVPDQVHLLVQVEAIKQ
jgi:polyisoprenoid-binding protein YceI